MISAPELHAMLEGWPREARPNLVTYDTQANGEGVLTWRVGCYMDFIVWEEIAAELACTSGLKWLMTHYDPKLIDGRDGQVYIYDENDNKLGSGPTLLHAVDGAVRGGKEKL